MKQAQTTGLFVLLSVLLWSAAGVAATLTVSNTNDNGAGSLRQAIVDANRSAETDLIRFNIPRTDSGFSSATGAFTIQPTSALPALTGNGITIDGTTQTAFSGNTNAKGPEIILNGAERVSSGLSINSAGCTIRGLIINGFAGNPASLTGGIKISGAAASGNRVEGCFLGTDAAGNAAVPNFDGVLITTGARNNRIGGTTINARNVISGNSNDGVGLGFSGSNGNLIQGNYIGVNASGQAALPNRVNGVALFVGASSNIIGGTVPGARNIISGNMVNGVFIGFAGTNNNVVQGNYIGINPTGASALPNGNSGVAIVGSARNNQIGGTTPGARNIISANMGDGVFISGSGTNNNIVRGNYLGLNAAGTGVLAGGRFANGVTIADGASNNTIGGTIPGSRNIMSGNSSGVYLRNSSTRNNLVQGNYIGLNPGGTAAFANGSGVYIELGASNNIIGGTATGARNVISGNTFDGIHIEDSGTKGNLVQGNYIGTNVSGTGVLPNRASGIGIVSGAASNMIGGSAGARNVISGNPNGIYIGGDGSNNNLVQGNYVGTNAAGTGALPNQSAGIRIVDKAKNNVIGGSSPGARNIISGNNSSGISINDLGTDNNRVQGNYIGTNVAFAVCLPNNGNGISIGGEAKGNLVGGTTAGVRNVISGHPGNGVIIWFGAQSNLVQGNYIGTDATGTRALPNRYSGIALADGAVNNIIGGTVAGARNIISGNLSGVFFGNVKTTRNLIQGNYIGVKPDGITPLPNTDGVLISNQATGNTIGGTTFAARNIISGNRLNGVAIVQDGTNNNGVLNNSISRNGEQGVQISGLNSGNSVRSNSIFSNGSLGINLQPAAEPSRTVTPNDANDSDDGPNRLQNFPVINQVLVSGGASQISGTLHSTPGNNFHIDFYRNTAADSSAFGEGEIHLGSTQVMTDSAGNTSFSFGAPGEFASQFFTATATNISTGDTSEFSSVVQATTAPAATVFKSAVTLSSYKVIALRSNVELNFTGALDVESASDAMNYSVLVNGEPVGVESAAYDASHRVILSLPEGSLRAGDNIMVSWQSLLDAQGNQLTGKARAVTTK